MGMLPGNRGLACYFLQHEVVRPNMQRTLPTRRSGQKHPCASFCVDPSFQLLGVESKARSCWILRRECVQFCKKPPNASEELVSPAAPPSKSEEEEARVLVGRRRREAPHCSLHPHWGGNRPQSTPHSNVSLPHTLTGTPATTLSRMSGQLLAQPG